MLKDTITHLSNKLKYKLHQVTYDSDAEEYAKNSEGQKDAFNDTPTGPSITTSSEDKELVTESKDAPQSVSISRIASKTGTNIKNIITRIILPVIGILLAMIIANDLIVYPYPIRIFGFIITILLCITNPLITIGLVVYYGIKALYGMYKNSGLLDKRNYIPHIYALLPITSLMPQSIIGKALMYPFNYPKTEREIWQLKDTMDEHLATLEGKFIGFDSLKGMPPFNTLLAKVKEDFKSLHSLTNATAPSSATAPLSAT